MRLARLPSVTYQRWRLGPVPACSITGAHAIEARNGEGQGERPRLLALESGRVRVFLLPLPACGERWAPHHMQLPGPHAGGTPTLNRTAAPLDYGVLVGYRQRANRARK